MLRISTTTLDDYRKFINTDFEDYETAKQNFILELKKELPTNIYMLRGSSFHEILDNPDKHYKTTNYTYNDIVFSTDCINKSLNLVYKNIDRNIAINEIKTTKIYDINNVKIELVSKADLLYGNTVIENKTAYSIYKNRGQRDFYNEYFSSLQWKCYIELFEVYKCKYNIFLLNTDNEEIELEQFFTFEFLKNQYNNNEILDYLEDFHLWLKSNGLEHLFIKG